MGRPCR